MKRKLLTTTLLSISLLSLNLSAAGQSNCSGGVCMASFGKKSPIVKKQEIKKDMNEYETVMVDNIETIVFSHSKYVMTEDEIAEYDLIQMQKYLLIPSLTQNSNGLRNSEYFCEDNLKAVEVVGVENTYECT